jgi:hypothetical protein
MKETYICQYCNRAISFVSAHGGFSDVLSFYCSKCPNVLVAGLYDEFVSYVDKKTDYSWDNPESRDDFYEYFEKALITCECGGRFKHNAKPRCPYCLNEIPEIIPNPYLNQPYHTVLCCGEEYVDQEKCPKCGRPAPPKPTISPYFVIIGKGYGEKRIYDLNNLELIEEIRKDANIIGLNLGNFDLKLKAIAALSIFRPIETLEYVNKLIESHKQYLPLISFDELSSTTLGKGKPRTKEQQLCINISYAISKIFENLALSFTREVTLSYIKQLVRIREKEELNYLKTNFKEADALIKSASGNFYYFSDILPGGDMDGILSDLYTAKNE